MTFMDEERDIDFIRDEEEWDARTRGERIGAGFHEECGYLWSVHDNTDVRNKLPFGCPSEGYAQERWGR